MTHASAYRLAAEARDFNDAACRKNPAGKSFDHFEYDPAGVMMAVRSIPVHFESRKACFAGAKKEYFSSMAPANKNYLEQVVRAERGYQEARDKIRGVKPAAKPQA